jgi:hypothetical protein
VLPEFTAEGDLPPGVHVADWQEFQTRFCGSSSRRVWLSGRLRTLLELAAINGKLRRVFIWGSFITAKPAPKDLDILLIMDDDFEVDGVAAPARAVFDSVRAKLLFEADVFWARSSIGHELLDLWLDTYQTSRSFPKTRYCGTGVAVIQTDDQMLLAQQCVANLRRILLEARKVHSRQDYARMAEPILLEVQQREQEILEYLTRDLEQPVAI